jgi:glutamine cyclotransferase
MKKNTSQSKHISKRAWLLLIVILLIAVIAGVVWLIRSASPDEPGLGNLTPYMTYEVVHAYPHDAQAFTQGLVYWDGFLYESTGLYGESSLRKVEVDTGRVVMQVDLPPQYFAEGLTLWEDQLIQLTWQEGTGFIYNASDFSQTGQFTYPTEGWGLTHDGERLILSDGSDVLYFLDPDTYAFMDSVSVSFEGEGVTRLNELEFIDGQVFANIWQKNQIVRIDPESGEVIGWIDLTGILPDDARRPETDVLNGIACDAKNNRLFITGKLWPFLYEIRLIPVGVE